MRVGPMPITNTNSVPVLTATVAVRLTDDECRALHKDARQEDRTVSYVVRAQLRDFLRGQQRSA